MVNILPLLRPVSVCLLLTALSNCKNMFFLLIKVVFIANGVSLGILTICPCMFSHQWLVAKRTEKVGTMKMKIFRIPEMQHQRFVVKHLPL